MKYQLNPQVWADEGGKWGHCLTFLLPWQNTTAKVTYKNSRFIEGSQFQNLWVHDCHGRKHGSSKAGRCQSSSWELTSWSTSIRSWELTENDMGSWNIKVYHQWHTSSNKATPLKPSQTNWETRIKIYEPIGPNTPCLHNFPLSFCHVSYPHLNLSVFCGSCNRKPQTSGLMTIKLASQWWHTTFISALRRQKQMNLCEARLVYRSSSRIARATQRKTLS